VEKFLKEETVAGMVEAAEATEGDLVLILAGPDPEVYQQMSKLRLMMGEEHELIDRDAFNFLWVTDFPLVEWSREQQRYQALHHPFTAPQEDEADRLDDEPTSVKSRAYDLVLNGFEIGGGSIRTHGHEVHRSSVKD